MEIKQPIDLSLRSLPTGQISDLLAQLKAAGSIEAEVIELLQDKLLLSTRLGQILTRNRLHYRVGDRFRLRLAGSPQNPVLKTSPAVVEPLVLDSDRYPQLRRVLLPGKPVLAQVTKVSAREIEIGFEAQKLTLPRPAKFTGARLITLMFDHEQHRIEIRPLDSKPIYKSILKQLMPRQAQRKPAALVRLLNLVSDPAPATAARPAPAITPKQQTSSNIERPLPATESTPIQANKATRVKLDADAKLSQSAANPPTKKASAPLPMRDQSATDTSSQAIKSVASHNKPALNQPAVQKARHDIPESIAFKAEPRAQSAKVVRQPQPPAKSAPHTQPPPPEPKANSRAIASDSEVRGGIQTRQAPNPLPANTRPAIQHQADTQAINQIATSSVADKATHPGVAFNKNGPAAPTATMPSAGLTPKPLLEILQPLLQVLPSADAFDPVRIRQWFSFSGLLRPSTAGASAAADSDPFRVLRQIAEHELITRLAIQANPAQATTSGSGEPLADKGPPPEPLAILLREAAKLIEQSLNQGVLQRASLGLQQEMQQPLTLSIALPFIDEHQVKPLYIDLAQRNKARQDRNRGWDIRLRFEFAGLGQICCHLVLEGMAVAASFYCEQAATHSRLEHALPDLRQQLLSAGFNPGEFHSFLSKQTPSGWSQTVSAPESLVDIEV